MTFGVDLCAFAGWTDSAEKRIGLEAVARAVGGPETNPLGATEDAPTRGPDGSYGSVEAGIAATFVQLRRCPLTLRQLADPAGGSALAIAAAAEHEWPAPGALRLAEELK